MQRIPRVQALESFRQTQSFSDKYDTIIVDCVGCDTVWSFHKSAFKERASESHSVPQTTASMVRCFEDVQEGFV